MRSSTILITLFAFSLAVGFDLAIFAQNGNPQARKFDEFTGDAQSEDIKARLDNFAIELQHQPNTQGHIIMYRSRREPPGISYRYVQRARNYLVETRGLASNGIVAVDGGMSDCFLYELWLMPAGAPQPERRYTYEREDSGVAYLFDLLDTWVNDDVEVPPAAEGNDWHLSAFAAELKKNPKSRGYIIAYPQYCTGCRYDGHKALLLRDNRRTIQNILRAKKSYLIREQGINPSRIVVVNGGYRKWREIELWIIPPKGYAPIPTPNQFPSSRRRR
jgi:hypothetical protein